MTAPNPAPMVLPPSPMIISQALASTIEILKRRLGLFVALALVPGLIIGVVLLVLILIGTAAVAGSVAGLTRYGTVGNLPAALGVVLALFVVAMLVSATIQIKANGMLTLLAHETALGRRPALADLNAGTRGIVLRTLVLILVAVAASAVFMGLFLLVTWAAVMAAANGTGSSSSTGLIGLFVLLLPLLWVAGVYFGIRWIYLNQGLAIEGRDGFGALGNSWRMTRNQFWRTLGWYLVAVIGLSVVTGLFSSVAGGLLAPATTSLSEGNSPFAGVAVVFTLLYTLLLVVLNALVAPAIAIYVTVMYIDQRRRNEMVAAGIPLRFQGQPYPQQGQVPGAMGFAAQVPPTASGQYPPAGSAAPYPPAAAAPGQYPPAGSVGQYPPAGSPSAYPPPSQYPAGQYPPASGTPSQYASPTGTPATYPPPAQSPVGESAPDPRTAWGPQQTPSEGQQTPPVGEQPPQGDAPKP